MLNHRAAPFHYFSTYPQCLPPPPRPPLPQFSYSCHLLHPASSLPPPLQPPAPPQFSYSYRHLPPPPPPPPFPYDPSSASLLCTPRFTFLSTYVACSTAPSPLPPPSFKYIPVAESSDSAGQGKTVASIHLQELSDATQAENLPSFDVPSATPTFTASGRATATSGHPRRPWLRRGARKRFVWVPRSNNEGSLDAKYNSSSQSSFELELSSSQADQRTSVMIKNIPNKLSREMLIALLDEHCVTENQKAPLAGSPVFSEYDFIYLPMDFKTRCNLGYAFVNFTTAAAAKKLHASLHGREWAIFGSRKVSHVCYARLQGKEALTRHFTRSYFRCDSDDFLPAVFDPPRNGSTFCPTPTTIGRRADPTFS